LSSALAIDFIGIVVLLYLLLAFSEQMLNVPADAVAVVVANWKANLAKHSLSILFLSM
jgi:hypothetical protein